MTLSSGEARIDGSSEISSDTVGRNPVLIVVTATRQGVHLTLMPVSVMGLLIHSPGRTQFENGRF